MKTMISVLAAVLFTTTLLAIPPEPPAGKKWVLVEEFSDEFNGAKLDSNKWYDYHPNWKGRSPGIFLPSQISVKDGYLAIKSEKLDEEKVVTNWNGTKSTYNIACGAVVSKSTEASFGYYECRFKAAKTTMSTTFWLSTRRNFEGPKDCNDSYGLELDIQECIGREGNFDGKWFAKGMHSNAHFWYNDCDGKKQDLRGSEVRIEAEELCSDGFNTYGGWWKDENTAIFYFNGIKSKTMTFNSSIKDKPFDQTMGLNLVSETYPYPWIELPNDEELADDSRNTCYYDWVRVYKLVDINKP